MDEYSSIEHERENIENSYTLFFFFNTYSSQGTFGTVKMFPEVQLI